MKRFMHIAGVLAVTALTAAPAVAQYPGEPRPAKQYDPTGDMEYDMQWGMPTEGVREAQRALHARNLYNGPFDGVLSPQFRRALWSFQRANGLPTTARLDPKTLAALDVPAATGAASPGATSNFGAR